MRSYTSLAMNFGVLSLCGTVLLAAACANGVDSGNDSTIPTIPGDDSAVEAPSVTGDDGSSAQDTTSGGDDSQSTDDSSPSDDSSPPFDSAPPFDSGITDVLPPPDDSGSCDTNNPIYVIEYGIAISQSNPPNCFSPGCTATQCCYLALCLQR
jgi:hypothetical protein